ncbi:MAG: 16S rRNA (cytosine(1402)-N(4))-methyltransferase RsmH [Nitrospirota bacterium]|nr:16S rRNA (cytosine(1402)-N(4))-methyltransferase RsmH [Nitrospirota bacterium]
MAASGNTSGVTGDAYHLPVLADGVRRVLAESPERLERLIDMTLGGGGHAAMLLEAAPHARLLGLDRDPAALRAASARLEPFGDRFVAARSTFDQVAEVARAHGFEHANGILMDVGVSSRQLDDAARGFSFRHDGPLDMRMDPDGPTTAADLVNTLDETELTRIFREYGEERHAARIARAICQDRVESSFTTTLALASLVERVIPRRMQGADAGRIHPATRIFQALRIAVNDELGMLERGLSAAFNLLPPGGRLAVISFHSLEDRLVKTQMADWTSGCICPREFPECRCGRLPMAKRVTRKPVVATAEEAAANPRSRSARLRAVERLDITAGGDR